MNVEFVYNALQKFLNFKYEIEDEMSTKLVEPILDITDRLFQELDEIGWDNVSYISEDFSTITFSLVDTHRRSHEFSIIIKADFLKNGPDFVYDLPETVNFQWNKSSTFQSFMNAFQSSIEKYQLFWNILDEFDSQVWIIDPVPIKREHTFRRIGIGPGLSLIITVDPNDPTSIPDCKILGADDLVEQARLSLSKNIDKWDVMQDLKSNLENVLQLEFRSKNNQTDQHAIYQECGICYSYRFEDNIPDKVCNNIQCAQAYHSKCLHEWLRFIPNCKQTLNTIFGECPYCSKVITCNLSKNIYR